MKTLSTFTISLAIPLADRKEFIEPSVAKESVMLLAPANQAESSQYASSIKQQQVQLQLTTNNTLTSQTSNTLTWLRLFGTDQYNRPI